MLYGVGIGPGDPELLTLKAIRVLKEVDIIAVPKSKTDGESIALDILKGVMDLHGKEIIELTFPMKKNRDELAASWNNAKDEVLKQLDIGKDVAFITIGDPLLYSTFIYLMEALKNNGGSGIKIKIVPGISSVNAASASACIPLANSSERLAIIPATYEEDKLRQTLKDFDTVVLMKVNKVMDKVIPLLEELGLKKNAIFVSMAGWKEQEVVKDLDTLKGRELDYFSIMIIKKS
ncbi:MAG: precorrin-2 C(20)-methyltransferase [Deltaproteobacteria bacterium GWC2_42_11]|nr:MAG: precorrin-2 C(20)-methyltransferase [Deltaproteobacteria bacterium GWC2_42_11]